LRGVIMVPIVKAVTFIKPLRTGRTCPCLMICEDDSGAQHEVVVKFRMGPESTPRGLTCELLASLLAIDLDLSVPSPFIVDIDPDFHEAISDATLAARFRASRGLNFGSQYLGPGFSTWPPGRSIPKSLIQTAAEIFVFDLMIQNPDRRKDKPNLLRKDDELCIFDHEMAFSFLYSLVPDQHPWLGLGMDYAKDHVFYRELKGRELSWDRLQGALEAVHDQRLDMFAQSVPVDWQRGKDDTASRIREYIGKARDNNILLFRKIRGVLV